MSRIALLCISPLRHDSRVLRHAALLAKAGHTVEILAQAPLPDTPPVKVTTLPGPGADWRVRYGMAARQAPATWLPATAAPLYWLSITRLAARRALLAFRPDLVIANDWRALPIALAAKDRLGARVIYDSHEFASEEFADSARWRLLAQRHVGEIERRGIARVDAVMTVSPGIAEALATRYRLPQTPLVVANMPPYRHTPFRPTGSVITVLYHGVVVPRRGLEALIESVAAWPESMRLVIRGPAQGGYDRQLQTLAAQSGQANRIAFEPPVAPGDVVAAAAATADIGIFLLANSTTHARFAMPNKIFEYMQAGLMIVSSDLPEIRKVIEPTDCGRLLGEDTPQAIAACFTGLHAADINSYKRAALGCAKILNFQAESGKLLTLVARVAHTV
ncbi:glycosyltransferase [Bosea sp. TWI1241]|uniref:glycosyltransferase n=1 Tax=Bosea sp. TWI1241 TaxID=3148904 RepID=UPI00320942FF